ncbi:transmembrane protein [Cystoisospora suis]|uniref:Transmembrane protein n=1 Tax=Cystoisospora suis TaxID=483139 RepID=A0A2C6KVS0_9APIC|nr:transmembrane protein [Cystoisospora suis]
MRTLEAFSDTSLARFPSFSPSTEIHSSVPAPSYSLSSPMSSVTPVSSSNHTAALSEGRTDFSFLPVSAPPPIASFSFFFRTLCHETPSLLLFPLSLAWLVSGLCAVIAALYLHQTRGSIMMAPTLLNVQFPLPFSRARGSLLRQSSPLLTVTRRPDDLERKYREKGDSIVSSRVRQATGDTAGGVSALNDYEPPPLIQIASPASDKDQKDSEDKQNHGVAYRAKTGSNKGHQDLKGPSSSPSYLYDSTSSCLPVPSPEMAKPSLGLSHYVKRQSGSKEEGEVHEDKEGEDFSSSSSSVTSPSSASGGGPSFFGQGSACSITSLVRSRRESLLSSAPSGGAPSHPNSTEDRKNTTGSECSRDFFSQDEGRPSLSSASRWTHSKGDDRISHYCVPDRGLMVHAKDPSSQRYDQPPCPVFYNWLRHLAIPRPGGRLSSWMSACWLGRGRSGSRIWRFGSVSALSLAIGGSVCACVQELFLVMALRVAGGPQHARLWPALTSIAYAELPLLLLFAACLRRWRPCLSASRFAGISILVGANVYLALLALSSPSSSPSFLSTNVSLYPTSLQDLPLNTTPSEEGVHRGGGQAASSFYSVEDQRKDRHSALSEDRDQWRVVSLKASHGEKENWRPAKEGMKVTSDILTPDHSTGNEPGSAKRHTSERTVDPPPLLRELTTQETKLKEGKERETETTRKRRVDEYWDDLDNELRKAHWVAVMCAVGALFYSVMASLSLALSLHSGLSILSACVVRFSTQGVVGILGLICGLVWGRLVDMEGDGELTAPCSVAAGLACIAAGVLGPLAAVSMAKSITLSSLLLSTDFRGLCWAVVAFLGVIFYHESVSHAMAAALLAAFAGSALFWWGSVGQSPLGQDVGGYPSTVPRSLRRERGSMSDDNLTQSLCEGLLGGKHGHGENRLEEGGPPEEYRDERNQDSKESTDFAADGGSWCRRESQRHGSRDMLGLYSEDPSEFTERCSTCSGEKDFQRDSSFFDTGRRARRPVEVRGNSELPVLEETGSCCGSPRMESIGEVLGAEGSSLAERGDCSCSSSSLSFYF